MSGTTLKDVQSATQSEQKISNEMPYIPPTTVDSPTIAPLKYVVFKLVVKGRRRVRLSGICDNAMNPTTKKRERIYLIQGAHSIWQSELKDTLLDKDYVKRNLRSPLFENGICRVSVEQDERLIEYLRANVNNSGKVRNGAGKWDFYEYDVTEEQKWRYEKQMNKIKMITTVNEMKEEPMKKLAFFLGITANDSEIGLPKTPQGIRTELLIKADSQPDLVAKYLGSMEVEVSYLVRRAILETKIDLQGQQGNAIWSGGGGLICKIPSSRKPLEYLVELAMTNSQDGKAFKEQLEKIIG